MATEKIDKANWRPMLDRATQALIGKNAEIEVASLAIGAQIEAEWIPLVGIAYDPKDNLIQVLLENGVDHLVRDPKALYMDIGPAGLKSMEIIDGDEVRHIIKLRDPLMLPSDRTQRAESTKD